MLACGTTAGYRPCHPPPRGGVVVFRFVLLQHWRACLDFVGKAPVVDGSAVIGGGQLPQLRFLRLPLRLQLLPCSTCSSTIHGEGDDGMSQPALWGTQLAAHNRCVYMGFR